MSKRSAMLGYFLLVGVPLLLLLLILHAGRRLTAPVSLGGAWDLVVDSAATGKTTCASLLYRIRKPFFTISQSGGQLQFVLGDRQATTFPGTLRGDQVLAKAPAARTCAGPKSIFLHARVSDEGDARVLTGTLGIDGCGDCAPVRFRALREDPPEPGSR